MYRYLDVDNDSETTLIEILESVDDTGEKNRIYTILLNLKVGEAAKIFFTTHSTMEYRRIN